MKPKDESQPSLSALLHDLAQPLSALRTFNRLTIERPDDPKIMSEIKTILPLLAESLDRLEGQLRCLTQTKTPSS